MENFTIKISEELKKILVEMSQQKSIEEKELINVSNLVEEAVMSHFNISIVDLKQKREELYQFEDVEFIDDSDYDKININHPYYVYIYLNPLKGGIYQYDEYSFNYEPIYVGKGYGTRDMSHTKTTHNESLKKIIDELDGDPIVIRVESGLSQLEAHFIENKIINSIGKLIDKNGPLCNVAAGVNVNEINYEKSFLNIDSMKYINILKSLNKNRSIKSAAKELGMSERTLYRKMNSLNIQKNPESNKYYIK